MSNLAEAPETGTVSTDEESIVGWRKQVLEEAGYNKHHARQIAERFSGPEPIDLHTAVRLVTSVEDGGKGCNPHTAADILI